MKLFKQLLFMLSVTLLLSACGSGGSSSSGSSGSSGESAENDPLSLNDLDLSGTWKSVTETRIIEKSTGEYLSSLFIENTVLFEETENGVLVSECKDYGYDGHYGTKSDDHFYIYSTLNGHTLQENGTLSQVTTEEYDYSPGYIYESTNTLSRISDGIELDNGTLVLNGPISVEEYSHVCLWQVSDSLGVSRTVELQARYGDSYLGLRLDIEGDVVAGVYQYDDRYVTDSEVLLDVSSNAIEFWDIVDSNVLDARNVTVNISEITDSRVLGSFEFTGQYDGLYDGEFEVVY
jgi:hypothetical protein